MILEGLEVVKDFKSIIYKMNPVSSLSIQKMAPLLEKRLPNHLEELKIIDCRINATLVSELMNSLLKNSQLRALSLVNIHHSPESFGLVIDFINENEFIKELDVSWSIVNPSLWLNFIEAVGQNRRLTDLNLAFN